MSDFSVQTTGQSVRVTASPGANTFAFRGPNGDLTNNAENCTQLTVAGAVALEWNAKTASYAMLSPGSTGGGDFIVYMDATGGARSVTLPSPSTVGAGNCVAVIKKDSSTNAVTIVPNGAETITGPTILANAGATAILFSDGTNWVSFGFNCGRIIATGAASTAAAGSNAGTSPPAPVVAATSNDSRGIVTGGTGTSPAAGNLIAVTFNQAFATTPNIQLTPRNSPSAALLPYVTADSTTGFTIAVQGAPAAGQANTVYAFNWTATG